MTWRARVGLILVGLVAVLLAGELVARAHYHVRYRIPFWAKRLPYPAHPVFGWPGHQAFGDPSTARRKLFVVGDSMTHGVGVPAAQMYYTVLGADLGLEVFAYGGAGYGTLQEVLVVETHLPAVRPDLVLLQTSENDFVNNAWRLERASYLNNNLTRRPYLEGDRIVMRFPSPVGDWTLLLGYSRLVCHLALDGARVTAALAGRGWIRPVEADLRAQPPPETVKNALATTELVVARLRARLGTTPLVAFSADDGTELWRPILARQGVPFIDVVPAAIRQAEAQGHVVRLDGAHWNSAGHQIVGAALAKALKPYLSAAPLHRVPLRTTP